MKFNPSNVLEYASWYEVMHLISLKEDELSKEITKIADTYFSNIVKDGLIDERNSKKIRVDAQALITVEKNRNLDRIKWLKKNNSKAGEFDKLIELGKLYSRIWDTMEQKLRN